MARRPNYGFEKRQRELKKQKKREEKAERKRLKKEAAAAAAEQGIPVEEILGETGAPIEIQNNILAFILGDEELREAVLDWGLNRTREEEDAGEDVELPDDETFARVADHIRDLWEDS